MKLRCIRCCSSLFMIACVPLAWAQVEKASVPHMVQFNGIIKESAGRPVEGVTFALYRDQEGGAPIWIETQNVSLDDTGRYTVMLGATRNQGLPMELFTSGEARWLGVQAQGQPEQPRILLLSVPYALKAGDAETVGGLPASAFMPASAAIANSSSAGAGSADTAHLVPPALTGSGTPNFIPLWTPNSNTLGNSTLFQDPSSNIGVGTQTPASKLDVNGGSTFRGKVLLPAIVDATAAGGSDSRQIDMTASVFNSFTETAVGETFGWRAEPAGNNTSSASATLNLLFGSGLAVPGETGLQIASNGQIAFAAGQTFPGTLTINAGTDLTGGGSVALGGSTTLNLNTAATDARYAQLNANNSFTGNQAITGTLGTSGNILTFGSLIVGGTALIPTLGVNQNTPRAALDVGDVGVDTLFGGTGCGPGYTGLGFVTSGSLGGCTNYALLGGPGGGTFLNSHGTTKIHFRSNNNELATIDNAGNLDVIGINGGGNLTVSGKVTSSNVAAQVSASDPNGVSCDGALGFSDESCVLPGLSLTTTTQNPDVLVMVNIGGVSTDPCGTAYFYLVIDKKIVALSTASFNTNNNTLGYEIGSVNITTLQSLAAGSHTFEVQASTSFGGSCNAFTGQTGISQGDNVRGSLRTLIVREL